MARYAANRAKQIKTGWTAKAISASSTTNVFGETFNMNNGPSSAARACDFVIADIACTVTGVTGAGDTVTGYPLQAGLNQMAFMMISSISGGASLFAGIAT